MAVDQTAYMRNYRKNNPSKVDNAKALQRAQQKALRVLRDNHRAEYEMILTEMKKLEGI